MAQRTTCDHCAEVIGVYEPVVLVIDGKARVTSQAAEPTISSVPGERYHHACYVERFGSLERASA
jgi:hypothetical protein